MTQEEIFEYNKRCAEFLGIKLQDTYPVNWKKFKHLFNSFEDSLKFHSDWNWIMEVVEAIEKKGYEIDIFSNCVEICDTPDENYITEAVGKTKKEAVVQAINQFLIWYNENN